MGGFCQAMERRRAIPSAIAAGADMLVFSTDIYEDLAYLRAGLENGLLSRERLDEAVTRVLALKAVARRPKRIPETRAAEWQRDCARKAATLVKDTQGLVPLRGFSRLRLIILGEKAIAAGADIAKIVEERLGLPTELYEPLADELHGPASLPEDRLTLVVANLPTASNQTAVRINWSRKHALDDPRFINEEPAAMISVANPYHLQDAPRIRTYINAYTPIAPASFPWASRRAAAFPRASRPPRPRPARSGQGPAGQAAPPARAGAGPGQSRRPHAPLRTLSCPPRGPARQP